MSPVFFVEPRIFRATWKMYSEPQLLRESFHRYPTYSQVLDGEAFSPLTSY